MKTYSKEFLSQSVNGKSVNIVATGTNTTIIHETLPSSGVLDEIWLYATNPTTSDVMLNVLYGGTNFNTDIVFGGIVEAYAGNVLICPGLILKGDGVTGSSIYGNTSVLSGINIFGYVNRVE